MRSIALHCIALHCIALHYIAFNSIALHSIAFNYLDPDRVAPLLARLDCVRERGGAGRADLILDEDELAAGRAM